ncbi:1,4-dihydroxy-2-naphthoate polyprenyltransferase [Paramicrobacterium agarici]|uniref:1,4-dihydroxy-2-naphthoate polyprenyltransferase n=1 Tax=Paramicrobacterium agarici TaxID=630514 RepID=UPI001151AE12|nr:1,4-dihydroxy-2-naphthoate polyprenyltransferase [Microbacterium agarici]TQO22410.1 1,4-dihydroxy-2-naphthoate prenyltransferase [Microbacterium agarici]
MAAQSKSSSKKKQGAAVHVARKGGGKSGNPAARPLQQIKPATAGDWIRAARIPTLPMSIAPVLVGTGAARIAGAPDEFHWVRALLCLAVAVALQIGVNFANDYSDGIRGTDKSRVGPGRLVGSGKASPRSVLIVALVFFGLAAVAGVLITIATQQWWLIAVGAACILAAWFYTGGKRPYGYYALGEIVVFIFFGLVATLGTMWVQVGQLNQEAWYGAVGVGLISMSAILVNNLRDRESDKLSRKHTLSVLIGNLATRIFFVVLMLVPFAIAALVALFYTGIWYAAFALLAALPACLIVVTARTPKELVLALKLVGVTQLLYGIAFFVGYSF